MKYTVANKGATRTAGDEPSASGKAASKMERQTTQSSIKGGKDDKKEPHPKRKKSVHAPTLSVCRILNCNTRCVVLFVVCCVKDRNDFE